MSFDQAVWLWCVIVPAGVAVTTVAASLLSGSRSAGAADDSAIGLTEAQPIIPTLLVLLLGWLAIVVTIFGRQGWAWWPEEAWQQCIWPLLAWAVWAAACQRYAGHSITWLLAVLIGCWTAHTAMPADESWSDTFQLHRDWIPLLILSCLLNCWSIERLAARGAQRWVLLVAVASCGGPAALAMSTYASLAESAVCTITVAAVLAAAALTGKVHGLWVTAIPLVVWTASLTVAARFYSYSSYPAWIYGMVLFLPTIVAAVDRVVPQRLTAIRVTVAAAVSAAIVTASVWCFLLSDSADY